MTEEVLAFYPGDIVEYERFKYTIIGYTRFAGTWYYQALSGGGRQTEFHSRDLRLYGKLVGEAA